MKQSEPIDCSWVEKTLRRHFEINDLACELLISAQGDATAAQTIIDKVVKFQHSSEVGQSSFWVSPSILSIFCVHFCPTSSVA